MLWECTCNICTLQFWKQLWTNTLACLHGATEARQWELGPVPGSRLPTASCLLSYLPLGEPAGATYNSRQEAVGSLLPSSYCLAFVASLDWWRLVVFGILTTDQPVVMVMQPDNAHDPNAVAVRTLGGHARGYVARALTTQVTQGHKYSKTAVRVWGATVRLSNFAQACSNLDAHLCNVSRHASPSHLSRALLH